MSYTQRYKDMPICIYIYIGSMFLIQLSPVSPAGPFVLRGGKHKLDQSAAKGDAEASQYYQRRVIKRRVTHRSSPWTLW